MSVIVEKLSSAFAASRVRIACVGDRGVVHSGLRFTPCSAGSVANSDRHLMRVRSRRTVARSSPLIGCAPPQFVRASALGLMTVEGYAAASDEQRIDNIPMYGQPAISHPDFLKKADEDFIKEASEKFGSRELASKAWSAQADQFIAKGDFDFAMRRYNQSWLLNPNNYQPYWGFGRVMLQLGKFDEAIQYLERSKPLCDDQYQKVALLADLGSAYSTKAEHTPSDQKQEKARGFSLANQSFTESTSLDPTYGNSWRRWAMSLYEQGNFAGAWEKVKRARLQNARPFPPAFLQALEQKSPEPN